MKKIVLLSVLFIFSFTKAQDFKIGLTFAPTISFNKQEVKVDNKWKTVDGTGGLGWKGGLLADYNFAGNYNLHSGILIHNKAFKGDDELDMVVSTLEIPLALKLRTEEVADNIRVTGFFGGLIDMNVGATVTDENGDEYDANDAINTFGLSFMVGTGAEYDLDFGTIGLGLSYHLGFTDISSDDNVRVTPKHLSIDLTFYF